MPTPPPIPDPVTQYMPTRSPAFLRAMGWLLIITGPLISLGMVALTMYLAPIVNAPTPPGSLPRYTGSHQMTVAAFSLFGALFVFGIMALLNGIYQARHGRQSRPLVIIFGVVIVAVIVLGYLVANVTNGGAAS